MRKALIFRNIIQEQRKKIWAESKSIAAGDINKKSQQILTDNSKFF